jgi:hypothetical protein
MLALQDISLFRQITKRPEHVRLPHIMQPTVPLSILDPVQGIILDSAPARLTPDIASRSEEPALPGRESAYTQEDEYSCKLQTLLRQCEALDCMQGPHSGSARPARRWN